MPSARTQTLSYTIGNEWNTDLNKRVRVVTATCHKCAATEALSYPYDTNSPDIVQKLFRNKGWDFDKHKRQKCICPKCKEAWARKPVNGEPDMAADNEKVTHLVRKPTRATDGAARPPGPQPLTPLTAEQRGRIRHALDEWFDDSAGQYLGGKSDKLLGTELDIPWKHVEQVRELAYGPLRTDPALDEAKTKLAELVAAETRITNIVEGCEKQLNNFRNELRSVSAQIDTLRERFSC